TTDAVDSTDSGSSADTGSEFSQGDTPEVAPVVDTSTRSMSLATAYFDYDRSEIRNDMRDILKLNAEVLQLSGATAMIEGHADERGSEEYNLALGERRAETIRKYMTALGVASSQLRIVSYGESKPAVSGHDDNAWRLNRRVEFIAR
ncbi:MAG: peptidoglycan-associated lipoprotein, partial [Myxococcota bacterium]